MNLFELFYFAPEGENGSGGEVKPEKPVEKEVEKTPEELKAEKEKLEKELAEKETIEKELLEKKEKELAALKRKKRFAEVEKELKEFNTDGKDREVNGDKKDTQRLKFFPTKIHKQKLESLGKEKYEKWVKDENIYHKDLNSGETKGA